MPRVIPVRVPIGDHCLDGDLALPPRPKGLVLFAHGSGSSRHSARNKAVARMRCAVSLEIVPGATHRFEEPGALDLVAALALHWFASHLATQPLVARP